MLMVDRFECDAVLFSLLQGFQQTVRQRLMASKSADEFLLELASIVRRITQYGKSVFLLLVLHVSLKC